MITVLFVFLIASVPPLLLILPAFAFARRKKASAACLLPMLHLPATTIHLWLVSIGFGRPQSMGNLIEVFMLGFAGVVAAYLKVFLVDRFTSRHGFTTLVAALLLVVGAVALRLLMPTMPE